MPGELPYITLFILKTKQRIIKNSIHKRCIQN